MTLISIIGDCPIVFPKEIGLLGDSRSGGQFFIKGIGQDPVVVGVLNSGGDLTQEDHVAGVSRQLPWCESSLDQRAGTESP